MQSTVHAYTLSIPAVMFPARCVRRAEHRCSIDFIMDIKYDLFDSCRDIAAGIAVVRHPFCMRFQNTGDDRNTDKKKQRCKAASWETGKAAAGACPSGPRSSRWPRSLPLGGGTRSANATFEPSHLTVVTWALSDVTPRTIGANPGMECRAPTAELRIHEPRNCEAGVEHILPIGDLPIAALVPRAALCLSCRTLMPTKAPDHGRETMTTPSSVDSCPHSCDLTLYLAGIAIRRAATSSSNRNHQGE